MGYIDVAYVLWLCLIDWLIDGLIDWLIGWLIDRLNDFLSELMVLIESMSDRVNEWFFVWLIDFFEREKWKYILRATVLFSNVSIHVLSDCSYCLAFDWYSFKSLIVWPPRRDIFGYFFLVFYITLIKILFYSWNFILYFICT